MKQLLLIIITLILSLGNICGQEITSVTSRVLNNKIYIYYGVDKIKFNKSLNTKVFVSFDNGKSFSGPLKSVEGDVGDNIQKTQNTVIWNPFEEYNSLEGDIIFDVRAEVIEKELKRKFFVNYSPSILISQSNYILPFGLQIGQIGKVSWYAAFRFSTLEKANYSFDGETLEPEGSYSEYYQFTGNVIYPTLCVTGGLTFQMKWNSFFYIGGGYRSTELQWELAKYDQTSSVKTGTEWANVTEYNTKGFEGELGFLFKAKMMSFSFGASVFDFSHVGIQGGIGVNF